MRVVVLFNKVKLGLSLGGVLLSGAFLRGGSHRWCTCVFLHDHRGRILVSRRVAT